MTTAQLINLRDLIVETRENLNDQVDVDTIVGDGDVRYRIAPYQSVAFDLERLGEAVRIIDATLRPTQVRIPDNETSFPCYVDTDVVLDTDHVRS